MIATIRTLIRLALLSDEDPRQHELAGALTAVTAPEWDRVVDELDTHRLTPLVGYTLRRYDCEDALPASARARLHGAYRRCLLVASLHARALQDLVAAFRSAGIEPIVFKGLVLGAGFYPDPGSRPMVDIDMLIGGRELRRAARQLRSLGYRRRIEPDHKSPNGFRNRLGLTVDLHWHFELFSPQRRSAITERLRLPGIGPEPVTTWEPNALVVHLVAHLEGHRRQLGLQLGWLLDIAFVVRACRARLEFQRMRELCPPGPTLDLLSRVLTFVDRECGVELPPSLAVATGTGGLSLARILREVRLRPWGLPFGRGWGRFLLSRFRRPSRKTRDPQLADLPLGLLDLLFEFRDARRAAAALRAVP